MCRRKHRTTGDNVSVHAPGPPQESLECDGSKDIPAGQTFQRIVRHLMGLPVAAGCDTARDDTRVCSDASSTAMQYLRPLSPSGGHS